jgi:hypothetical protein
MAPTFNLLPIEVIALTRRPDFWADGTGSGSGLMDSRATPSCNSALTAFDRVMTVLVTWPLEKGVLGMA